MTMKTGFSMVAGLLAITLAVGCNKTTTEGPTKTTATPNKSNPTTPEGKKPKLTLMAAENQTVKQGETDEVSVAINRDNFDDDVMIGFEHLPKGVTLVEANPTILKGKSTATVNLKAAPDAEVGEFDVTLFVQATGIDKNPQTFKLKVDKKS